MSTQTTAQPTNTIAHIAPPEEKRHVGQSLTQVALRRLRRDHLTVIAISIVLLLAILSLLAPIISELLGVNYTSTEIPDKFLPLGAPGHILGTDDLGRDQLSRLLYAGQVSLSIGFVSAILSLVIGVALGVITGYYGGVVDDVVNWLITTLNSIPSLFLLLIIFAVSRDPNSIIPQSTLTLILVLALLGWTSTTRLVRGETLSLREREYIISARAIGASSWRIMFAHIVPNLISILVVTLAIDIGVLILVELSLSFLGFGVKPPTPSWGNMLTEASSFYTKGPHLVVMPGLLITITVLCLYVIGDGLRDAFDPTSKE